MLIRELLMASQIGICTVLIVFCSINSTLSIRKRFSLLAMSVSSMVLAVTDCFAHLDASVYLDVVKISKFCVYLMPLMIIHEFNNYLKDFLKHEKLKVIDWIIYFGIVNLIISQFTGWYYCFNEDGYLRGRGYFISYIFPIIATIIQLVETIKNRKNIRKKCSIHWLRLLFCQ